MILEKKSVFGAFYKNNHIKLSKINVLIYFSIFLSIRLCYLISLSLLSHMNFSFVATQLMSLFVILHLWPFCGRPYIWPSSFVQVWRVGGASGWVGFWRGSSRRAPRLTSPCRGPRTTRFPAATAATAATVSTIPLPLGCWTVRSHRHTDHVGKSVLRERDSKFCFS